MRVKFAVTLALPVIVSVHPLLFPLHPLQLENTYPEVVDKLSDTDVPEVYPPEQFWGVLTVMEPAPAGFTLVDRV